MPGYERAEVTAELKVITSNQAERPPQEQIQAAKKAAGESSLAREAGPETTMLAGGRSEVLEMAVKIIEASLDAGAHAVEVKVEAEADAPRFDG
jgi:uncharacterized protein YqgV (UPF0045/DUF77 family)